MSDNLAFYPEFVEAYPAPPQLGGNAVFLRFTGDLDAAAGRYNVAPPLVVLAKGTNQCAYSGFIPASHGRPMLFVSINPTEEGGLLTLLSSDSSKIRETIEHFLEENRDTIKAVPFMQDKRMPFSLQ